MKLFPAVLVALSGIGSLALADSAVGQTVVMSGLDNPRGLAFAPNGALYVAEAGRLPRVNSHFTVIPLLEGLNRPP